MEAVPVAEQGLTPTEILSFLPHRRSFRFVDEVLNVSETLVAARYTFRRDEYFYEGHFPNYKVTPGAILLEAMSQMGTAALGLYLMSLVVPRSEITKYDTVMTESEIELSRPVYPGETVECRAEKIFWRYKKLRTKVELRLADGSLAAIALIGGMSIKGRA